MRRQLPNLQSILSATELPVIGAHRGSTEHNAYENTLQAFIDSIEMGVALLEVDIRRCSDGRLICHHDPMIGAASIETTPFDECQSIASSLGFTLLPFEDCLTLAKTSTCLDIEIKKQGTEFQIAEMANRILNTNQFVITSFDDTIIYNIKHRYPSIQAGLILGRSTPRPWLRTRLSELFPRQRLRACLADFVVPNYQLLRLGFQQRMRLAGYPVWTWTVNTPSALQKHLFDPTLSVVMTDHCAEAIRIQSG